MPERDPSTEPTPITTALDERGGVAIEYALLAAFVALTIVGTLTQLGGALVNLPLSDIVDAVEGEPE